MKKAVSILLALLLLVCVSCENKQATCKVTYFDGSTVIHETTVSYGASLSPAAYIPTKEGYIFLGWYYDYACTDYFDGSKAITKDTQLYSKWAPGSAAAYVKANIILTDIKLAYGDKVTAVFSAGGYSVTRSEDITDTSVTSVVLDSYAVATTGTIGANVISVDGVTKGALLVNVTFVDGQTYDIPVPSSSN